MKPDWIPQKRVAAQLGVSRSSLWRARRSGIQGFPAPCVCRARVYWRPEDLPALAAAMERFEGRGAFEAERRHAKARETQAQTRAAKRRKRVRARSLRQPDLFDGAEANAPGGAEPVSARDQGPSTS